MPVNTKSNLDFFALKGSVKTKKPFDIKAIDKTVEDAIVNKYRKK